MERQRVSEINFLPFRHKARNDKAADGTCYMQGIDI